MAGNFNRVFLMGNLTRDPELRHTQSNMAVATIGLAVNRRWRDQSGEQKEETTFVDCEAWGKTAETMCSYLAKGRPVFIEGRLRLDTWQDKTSGENRSKLKVVVENFQFVDSKAGSGGPGGGSGGEGAPAGARRGAPAGGRTHSDSGPGYEPVGDEDIPF